MVSKSSSTRTIRLQNELWEWLAAEAERRGVAVNGLVATLLEVGRLTSETRRAEPTLAEKQLSEALSKPRLQPTEKPAKPKPFKSRLKGEWKAP